MPISTRLLVGYDLNANGTVKTFVAFEILNISKNSHDFKKDFLYKKTV